MDHRTYSEWLTLLAYDELDDDARRLLEGHLKTCAECRGQLAQVRSLRRVMSRRRVVPVTNKLLNDARRERRVSFHERRERPTVLSIAAGFLEELFAPRLRLAISSAALVLVGFVSGWIAFHSPENDRSIDPSGIITTASPEAVSGDGDLHIQNLRFVDRDARTGDIEIQFDAVTPYHVRGNINEERIQRVLARALVSDGNPGMRLRAVNMIADQSENRSAIDQNVKQALISALKYDRNFSVRTEALAVLQNYLPDPDAVQAILYVLANEKNTGMKVAAINALGSKKFAGHPMSAGVRKALQQTADSEENNYIRIRAHAALQEDKP
jgi:hypothetical protein